MALQLGSQCNSRAEEEDAVQRVKDDHDDRVTSPVNIERGWEQVEQGEHRENRYEDRVVHR